MELMSMRVLSNPYMIPVVQAAVSNVAEHCKISKKDRDKLSIALEEAMSNIMTYGFPDDERAYFDISIEVTGMDFIIVIHDQGKPYDFEDVSDDISSSAGLKLMKGLTDGLLFANLGGKGREQRLIKHLTSIPAYQKRHPEEPAEDLKDITFDIHPLQEKESIEISQCVYDEFGYSYPSELVYYPKQYFEACKNNEYFSLVATAPNGEIAGHLALIFSPHFPGVAEMGIGVVKKKFRNYSLMSKLTNEIIRIAKDEFKLNALTAQPVAYHPYTQKICNKTDFHVCGFVLHYLNYEFISSFDNVEDNGNVAMAFRVFQDGCRDLYVPDEVRTLIDFILANSNINRNICAASIPDNDSLSEVVVDVNQRMRIGKIFIERVGADIYNVLKNTLLTVKREKCAIVELFLNLQDPCAPYAYSKAKELSYFCTGILPCTNNGDYLMMQCLLRDVVNYDNLVTIEPFTTVVNTIRKLDPNEC